MLTPDEIELKTFPVTLRGFDQVEVTGFLQDVAEQLRTALERARSLEAGTVIETANRAAAEIVAKAEAEAKELTRIAETTRDGARLVKAAAEDEAARVHADALALSERELKQAVQECEDFRLRAVEDVEAILRRADAEVSAMLRAVRDRRDDLANIGQQHTLRVQRKGSQRQLGH